MELYDIAPAYYEAAQRVTEKMQRLRAEFPDMSTNDPALSSLKTLRKELRDVGRLCEHYYEGGFWRDERYTFNSTIIPFVGWGVACKARHPYTTFTSSSPSASPSSSSYTSL